MQGSCVWSAQKRGGKASPLGEDGQGVPAWPSLQLLGADALSACASHGWFFLSATVAGPSDIFPALSRAISARGSMFALNFCTGSDRAGSAARGPAALSRLHRRRRPHCHCSGEPHPRHSNRAEQDQGGSPKLPGHQPRTPHTPVASCV